MSGSAIWIVWENEGNKYTLKGTLKDELQLTVKRSDGSWEHLGVGRKDLPSFIEGIKRNPENKVIQIHEKFKPKNAVMSQAAKALWAGMSQEERERRCQGLQDGRKRVRGLNGNFS